MLGSLQEFMPECLTEPSGRSFLAFNIQKQPIQSACNDYSTRITSGNSHQGHLNSIKFAQRGTFSQLDSQGQQLQRPGALSYQKQRSQSDRANNYNPHRKLKTKEFVADDKSFLLAHYHKLRKHKEIPHREHHGLDSLRKIGSVSAPRQQSKPSFMHLKGKLRQNHHLLKSLVQVQEMQQANPQTFFEISFKQMCEQFQKTKLEHTIRKELRQYSSVDKPVQFPLTLWSKKIAQTNNIESKNDPGKPGRTSPSRRLLQQNQTKWISSRSKSLELDGKDTSKAASLQRRENELKRRAMIDKIDKLLDRAPKNRKYSTRSNRRNSLHCMVSKFK